MSVSEIISFLNTEDYKLGIDGKQRIHGFKPISSAKKGEMTFCSAIGEKAVELISSSEASVIICPLSLKEKINKENSALIFVDRPRLSFLRSMKKFHIEKIHYGIHPSAILESKNIGKNVYIGPHAYIGRDVIIGNNTIIHGNVYIYGNTKIGNNVIIDASTVIGADGFGFERNESNQWEKFPHIGGVEIHDNVEIGANVCIDRGTLDNTTIGESTKIDNLVHVAHNAKIGKNCIVVAQALIAGSCVLEDNAYIAMCAVLRDTVRIGKNSMVGMGAVVTKDVPSDTTVIGIPARPIKNKET